MNVIFRVFIVFALVSILGTVVLASIPTPITDTMENFMAEFLSYIGYLNWLIDVPEFFDLIRVFTSMVLAIIYFTIAIFLFKQMTQ